MIWNTNQYILFSLDVLLGIVALILVVYLIVQLLRKPKPSLEAEMEKGKSEEVPSGVAKPAEKSAIMEATPVESLSTDVMQTAYLPQPDVNQGTKSGGDPVSESSTTEENPLDDESEMASCLPFLNYNLAFRTLLLSGSHLSRVNWNSTRTRTWWRRLLCRTPRINDWPSRCCALTTKSTELSPSIAFWILSNRWRPKCTESTMEVRPKKKCSCSHTLKLVLH